MQEKYNVCIVLNDDRKINLCLESKYAPKSVENFIKLVNEKFYDGVIFHRVIENFMIQTGGYYIENNRLLEKDVDYTIKGEFKSNGFNDNTLSHKLGVISMARTNDKNSASTQFFICSANCSWLDGEYAAFGYTTDEESNKVVLELSKVETFCPHPAFADFPVEPISIKTIELL